LPSSKPAPQKTSAVVLKAKVYLHAGPKAARLQKLLEEKKSMLPALFIVSQVEVAPAAIPAFIPAESLRNSR